MDSRGPPFEPGWRYHRDAKRLQPHGRRRESLTSKGASGVTGAGFVTLAVVNPALAPGMAMAPGIDKFTSERRALADICGNGLAAIVISAPEGELDRAKLNEALADGAGVLEPAVAAAE